MNVNGHSVVDVATVSTLIEQINATTASARALLPNANAETVALFSRAYTAQREGMSPEAVRYLSDQTLIGTPQREAYAREWVAWAQVHLNTLRSVVILASAATAEMLSQAVSSEAVGH